jgi:glycolate oxidase iron-sulfur subunit
MQTQLSPEFQNDPAAVEAAAILRKCVHCGFCNATCPTYQLLGDELDGPRGRIYLIKQMLEGGEVTRHTQQHLDRCLTCLNCETTCPSGVQYGKLVETGRNLVEARVPRSLVERSKRRLLRDGLTSKAFGPALRLGRMLRPLLPRVLRDKIPATDKRDTEAASAPADVSLGKILILSGCVQPGLLPNIDRATHRVLRLAGFDVIEAARTGCCGALRTHLADHEGGVDDMRRNIDCFTPYLNDPQLKGIISTASACALMLKQYQQALKHDPVYAMRAAQVSAYARDLSELLPAILPGLQPRLKNLTDRKVVFHPPCTLQHGQRLRGGVESALRTLGFEVDLAEDSHLCCGSAGAYSVLQPQIANQLRDRKLAQLQKVGASCVISANVGCITHLQAGTQTPVKHWVELLDEVIS